MLYRDGPCFYHADYVVITKDIDDETEFIDMQTNNRVAETAHKLIILFSVKRPPNSSYADPLSCISRLNEFRINEVLPKRFQSTQGFKDTTTQSTSK